MEKRPHKQGIRSKYLSIREGMSRRDREEKSRLIWENIRMQKEFQEAEIVLVYMDYRTEVMTSEFVEDLLCKEKTKRVFAPVVDGYDISFYEIHSSEELHSGYQGIREPDMDENLKFTKVLAEEKKCFALTPGSVYDHSYHRMGYGKGFYDRFFGKFPNVIKAGIGFSCQIAPVDIPSDDADIKVDMIITENGRI